jgi:hypothetical protein
MTDTASARPGAEEVAHLFVDFSNIWYATRAEASRRGDPEWAVRIHADNLHRILAGGRRVRDAVLVANREIAPSVLGHFRRSFQVDLVEAGCVTGTEQAGDEMLQNAIYRTIFRAGAPGTIVLATGDGAGWSEGRGFCEALRAARERCFGVEVVSFNGALNGRLRALARAFGAMIPLDPFYDSVAFLEGLRPARPSSLVHRPSAAPRLWSAQEGEAMARLKEATAA